MGELKTGEPLVGDIPSPLLEAIKSGSNSWTEAQRAEILRLAEKHGYSLQDIYSLAKGIVGLDKARGMLPKRTDAVHGIAPPERKGHGDKRVALKVFNNDPTDPPVVRYLPLEAFTLEQGRPVGLTGPHVKIVNPDKIGTNGVLPKGMGMPGIERFLTFKFPVDNIAPTVTPGPDGNFLVSDDGLAIAQTTAFYAANQVHDLALSGTGMDKIGWGENGQLTIVTPAFVTTRSRELNATAFGGNRQQLEFGAVGDIANGRILPVEGAKLRADLEQELQRKKDRLGELLKWSQKHGPVAEAIDELQTEIQGLETAHLHGRWDGWGVVDAGKSREIVAHEAGHAVLQQLKPGWKVGLITKAFHEAYADLASFLTALKDEALVSRIIQETGGDLSVSHVATKVAEQLGSFSKLTDGDRNNDQDGFLRDLNNKARLSDFGVLGLNDRTLPSMTPEQAKEYEGKLECHHLCNLLTGAWYGLFRALVDEGLRQLGGERTPGRLALVMRGAGDTLSTLIHRSLFYLPESAISLRETSTALLLADQDYFGGKHQAVIAAALRHRGLLDADPAAVVAKRRDGLPSFRLPPGETRPEAIVASLTKEVIEALAHPVSAAERGFDFKEGALRVVSDTTSKGKNGVRVVRLLRPDIEQRFDKPPKFELAGPPKTEKGQTDEASLGRLGLPTLPEMDPGQAGGHNKASVTLSVNPLILLSNAGGREVACPARYVSLVFDARGELIALHNR